ncbi:hypothetical protein COS70_02390 [Candidatus Micrarchaeota archaeon CG06_land_8_20_14_3_00_50_6]|nr:MAG: hypothetical protein COS70_02390 [Candidatus Micrarchaeota archaeon CG06_land_8_20_14_3_00_50_6]HII39068.1 hypothetical protein [Candidatus Micrarchaeota archaeon]
MEEMIVENAAEVAAESKGEKPQFTVRQAGADGYAGSAWKKQGKYGAYISVAIEKDVPKGATLFINPKKANPAIIG